MDSLTLGCLQKMTIEQLKDAFKYAWNQCGEYFYVLENQLSYYALKKWSMTLAWCHPAARYIDRKLHQRKFRGKCVKSG